jgi:hypothetical protein
VTRSLLTVLLLLPAVARAKVDYKRESPAVAVLRAVMLYRIEHLADRTRFDACRAFEAMGRPADFLVSEYDYSSPASASRAEAKP